jgi:hypothetical protein
MAKLLLSADRCTFFAELQCREHDFPPGAAWLELVDVPY